MSPTKVRLGDEKPRGWSGNSTFDDVDGLYASDARRVGLGHNHTTDARTGDKTAALHELGHVLDDAYSHASSNDPELVAIIDGMQDGRALGPYFTHEANPTGYRSELFAQAHFGWAEGRAQKLKKDDLNRFVRSKLGAGLSSVPDVDGLIKWFDAAEARLTKKYRAVQDHLEGVQ